MLWSWHCSPRSELRVSILVAMSLCLLMDGTVLGTEEGTALFLPGQCLSAAQGQEKDAKSLFPVGEVLQQGGLSPTPTALTDLMVSGFPLSRLKGHHVPSSPALPGSVSLCTARSCVPPFTILGTLSLVWVDIPGRGTPCELNCCVFISWQVGAV